MSCSLFVVLVYCLQEIKLRELPNRTTLSQAIVKRALELADRAASSWEVIHTDFYTPPIVSEIIASVKPLASIEACAWGGFPQAERCRVLVGKEDLMLAAMENLTEVRALLQLQSLPNILHIVHAHACSI